MAYTTINKSSDYFNTNLWTGTGSTQTITTGTFQPNFSWIKNRSRNSYFNLIDAVRGATKQLATNGDYVESTDANQVSAFTSTGFTVGTGTNTNASGEDLVAWNWKANGQGSANTSGSINTTYTSANTTSGFSISTYTGTGSNATVGHGLGVAPSMIIIKRLNSTNGWTVYHKSLTAGGFMYLNVGEAYVSYPTMFQNTDPTTTVFSVGTLNEVNASGGTYVAYCFAEKTGFSKFGSYTGNGNADGAFVYTGFKPAFVMIKRYDSGTLDWNMYDSKRLGYNGGDAPLFANLTNAESNDYGRIDFVSNGFKIRTSNDQLANNGGQFLYMCFAEAPLVGSNNVPANAR